MKRLLTAVPSMLARPIAKASVCVPSKVSKYTWPASTASTREEKPGMKECRTFVPSRSARLIAAVLAPGGAWALVQYTNACAGPTPRQNAAVTAAAARRILMQAV